MYLPTISHLALRLFCLPHIALRFFFSFYIIALKKKFVFLHRLSIYPLCAHSSQEKRCCPLYILKNHRCRVEIKCTLFMWSISPYSHFYNMQWICIHITIVVVWRSNVHPSQEKTCISLLQIHKCNFVKSICFSNL